LAFSIGKSGEGKDSDSYSHDTLKTHSADVQLDYLTNSDVIRMKLTTTRIAQPHAEVVEQGFQEAKQQQDQSHKYVQLAAEFQILSAALESERVRFKKLKDFRKKAEVRESLARLKETFREELSENAADAQQMVPADVPASASLRQGRG
jgi:hypothetical protein